MRRASTDHRKVARPAGRISLSKRPVRPAAPPFRSSSLSARSRSPRGGPSSPPGQRWAALRHQRRPLKGRHETDRKLRARQCSCSGVSPRILGRYPRVMTLGLAVLAAGGCGGEAQDAPRMPRPARRPLRGAQVFAPGEISVTGTSISRVVLTTDGKTAFDAILNSPWPWEKLDRPSRGAVRSRTPSTCGPCPSAIAAWSGLSSRRGSQYADVQRALSKTVTRDGTLYLNSDLPRIGNTTRP